MTKGFFTRYRCRAAARAAGRLIGRSRRLAAADSGTVAVEFALVSPLYILVLFGIITYGAMMSTYSAVQQLVAEAARSTVGGLSNTERDQMARAFVSANVGTYPLLDPTKLTVTTAAGTGTPSAFNVTVSYDMSTMFIYSLAGVVPLPGKTIVRTSSVQFGGY